MAVTTEDAKKFVKYNPYRFTRNPKVITPADGSNLDYVSRGITVHTAGAVHILDVDGNEVTLTLPTGFHEILFIKVFSTGTTATGLTGHPAE